MQEQIHKFFLPLFLVHIISNKKLKLLLMVTDLNKFGYIGLPIFHEAILLSRMTVYPFQKIQYVEKDKVFVIRNAD